MADATSRWSGALRGRIAYGSGAAFSVLALVAFLLARGPDQTDGRSILTYFARHDDAVHWQAALFGVAAAFFIWFIGMLAARFRAGDPENPYAAILVVSGAVTVALYMIGVGGWLAVANAFGGVDIQFAEGPAFGDAATFWNVSDASFTLSNYAAAVFLFAAVLGLAQQRLIPDWLSGVGGALAALLLVQGFVQTVSDADVVDVLSFVGFVAWFFVVSVLLVRSADADTASPS